MYAHVLLEHRPSKVNIYGENKTHSREALKKEEEEEEGREGGQESTLLQARSRTGLWKASRCHVHGPSSPQCAVWREEEERMLGAIEHNGEASGVEPDWHFLLGNVHWLMSWDGVAGVPGPEAALMSYGESGQ